MPTADDLVQAALQLSAADFGTYVQQFQPSQALGEDLNRVGSDALDGRNAEKAATAYRLAESVFGAVGSSDDAFASAYMYLQVGFMAAQTEDQYRSIYEQSQAQIGRAASVPFELRFEQIVLAADTAFWAASVASDATKREWLDRSFEALASVEPAQGADAGVARYASVLIADLKALADLEPDPAKSSQVEARFSTAAASLSNRQFSYPEDPKKGPAVADAMARIGAGRFFEKKPLLYGRKNP